MESIRNSEFESAPLKFLESNVVTTWNSVDMQNSYKSYADLNKSGAIYNFGLAPVSDNSGYMLYPTRCQSGISAYWLQTYGTIEVPAYTGPKFIFTPELNGCSIYVRMDALRQTLRVYHHYRDSRREQTLQNVNGKYVIEQNGRMELYDDVLAYERYGPWNVEEESKGIAVVGAVNSATAMRTFEEVSHHSRLHTTAFLYRDDNNQWYFIYQRFRQNESMERLEPCKLSRNDALQIGIKGVYPPPALVRLPENAYFRN